MILLQVGFRVKRIEVTGATPEPEQVAGAQEAIIFATGENPIRAIPPKNTLVYKNTPLLMDNLF